MTHNLNGVMVLGHRMTLQFWIDEQNESDELIFFSFCKVDPKEVTLNLEYLQACPKLIKDRGVVHNTRHKQTTHHSLRTFQ